MKLTQRTGIFIFFIALVLRMNAQIAGSFTVPIDFPNMAAAINTLNVMGVAGSVTIYVNAGYTETVAAGGLKLFNVPGASAVNSVTFKKNGIGSNPLLVAYAGGVGTPTTTIQDGVWWLIGADYITIDGIDISDPNTSNPATMEFGYGLYNASTGDGCQYNTIKNCIVTLNRINASLGAGLNAGGSRAIESICASYTQNVTTYTPSSASGTHSYNKFYSNLVQNCHNGITLMGYQSISPYTLSDKQNDVGGTSAVTGNTVVNFGGGVGSDVSGIRTKAQYSLNVSFNILKNNTGAGVDPTGDLHAINLGAANGASTSVNGNTITLSVAATNSIDVYGIRNAYGSTSATVQILNNVFPSCSFTGVNGTIFLINDYSSSALVNVSNNLFQNTTGPADPRSARMIETHYSSSCTVNSNTVTNFTSQGTLYGIISGDHTSLSISNNRIDNIYAGRSVNAITHSYGTTTGASTISLNSVGNFTTSEGRGISAGSFSVTKTISGNTVSSVFSPATTTIAMDFNGIDVRGGSATITDNAIHTFTGAAATATYNFQKLGGIVLESVNSARIERNKIGSFTYVGKGAVQGIYLLTSYGHTVANNVIGDLNNTKSTRSDGLVGIYIDQSGSISNSYYYNTVYLNSASTSTGNSGSAAMIFPSSASITLRNNILVNTSVSTGTGVTTVIRKPNTTLSDYAASSNNNIFYAGPPAANRYIYHDGVNTFTTLADFKTYASPREAQSYSENPPFITINGAMSNFLSMNPGLPTLAEGTAVPITGFTIDYAGTNRNATTPDIGAWEGNFLQADIQTPTIVASGFTSPSCDLAGRTLTVNITDASGVASGSISPRVYYRRNFGLYISVQGSLSSGTYSNGVWTFSLAYSGVASDIVRYFFTMQDLSPLNNLVLIPSAGGSITSVNNVPVPPTTTFTYALETAPSINVNSGSICSGESFTINPGGASSYTITGGSFTVSPVTSTSYSIIGTSTAGCLSSNTAVASVSVVSSPTVSVNSGSVCSGQSFTLSPSGADSYSVTGGILIVTPSATSVYTVTGTNTLAGCFSSPVTATVQVFITPTVAVNSGSICSGKNFTITPSGADLYNISGGAVIVSPASNTVYLVSGTSLAGCASSNTVSASLTVAPLPTLSVSDATICSGTSYTLSPSGAGSYVFSGGTAVVSPATNTFYTITGTSSLGCASSNTVISNITVKTSPTITVNSGSICAGQVFTITPSDPALTYTYPGGSALVSPGATTLYTITGINSFNCASNPAVAHVTVAANPTLSVNSGSICIGNVFTITPSGADNYTISGNATTVSPATNTVYTITGISLAGCAATNTVTSSLTVAPLPTVTAANGTVCSGKSYTISPSGAATYNFSGGTGIVSPLTNTLYTISGTSSVGCTSFNTVTISITVNTSPSITVNSGSICAGSVFTIVPSDPSLTYNIPGGATLVSPPTSTLYAVSGTNSLGCVSNSVNSSVTVNQNPTISVNSGSICQGQTFTIVPSNPSLTYIISGGATQVSPSTNTLYNVSGSSSFGCLSNTVVSSVTVNINPTVTVNSGSICAGSIFTIIPVGAISYSIAGGSSTVAPLSTTSYTVLGLSAEGCASQTLAISSVTVVAGPVITVNSGSICAGSVFTLNPLGATSYSYSSGSATVAPANTGTYQVSGTSTAGCIASVIATVGVNSLPIVTANASSTSVCSGQSLTLYGGGAQLYTWSGGITNNVAFYPSGSAMYTVTGTDANTCSKSTTVMITVLVSPTVVATSSTYTLCEGEPIVLTATGADTYLWSTGATNGTISIPANLPSYNVTGSNSNGCSHSASVSLFINACAGISQLNKITHISIYPNPNKGIFYMEMEKEVESLNVQIANTLGQVVYRVQILDKSSEIDLRLQAKGIYFVRIYEGLKLIQTEKLIVTE